MDARLKLNPIQEKTKTHRSATALAKTPRQQGWIWYSHVATVRIRNSSIASEHVASFFFSHGGGGGGEKDLTFVVFFFIGRGGEKKDWRE